MANPEHVELVKKGAEAIREWREDNKNVQLELGDADLSHANLSGAPLNSVNLSHANLSHADLTNAKLDHTSLTHADLTHADLTYADLTNSNLSHANLSHANLTYAKLAGANLLFAKLKRTVFFEARLNRTKFEHARATRHARFLDTVVVQDGPSYLFEKCERAFLERWLDWKRIRTFGRLPLFTASYLVLLGIPVFIFLLAQYNHHLTPLLEWAKVVAEQPDHDFHELGIQIKEHLSPIAPPSQMAWAWVASVFLAFATTLYHSCCPSRVKEFSKDQWCDEHKNDLIHYWPLSWKHRPARLICATSYIIGGTLALWIIGTKAWRALDYIIENTPNPWSLL